MSTKKKFDYKKHKEDMKRGGEWVFIVPISGVKLTESVNNEFKINRVLLVSKEKLPRIRSRLGLPTPVSQMHSRYKEYFSSSDTFAVVRQSGELKNTKNYCRKLVQDELSILSLSKVGYERRRFGSYPSIRGEPTKGMVSDFLIDVNDSRVSLGSKIVGHHNTLVMSGLWKGYQKNNFFLKYLKIIRGETNIESGWKNDLERAGILIGQSQCSSDLAQSFLWNMIALEMLLTRQGDKYLDVLPKRIEAFLGWVGFWEYENYEEKIKSAYKKRCALVHNGKRELIAVEDLLFTDDLLLNLLINLIQHIKIFKSKDDVIDFSNKVEAEHLLGVTPRVRPKSLQFSSRHYTEDDYLDV